MGLNGINASTLTLGSAKTNQTKSKRTDVLDSEKAKTDSQEELNAVDPEDLAVVYEKSTDTASEPKTYTQNTAIIDQMKADVEKRTEQLRGLVEKLLLKQGQTFDDSKMYELLREGEVPVDEETAAKAKEDISEDGYWGVNQTSDRMVSFAIALSGGDTSKADAMIEAIKKGYKQAEDAWGGELPELCQKTLEATIDKLNKWKNSKEDSSLDTATSNSEGDAV